LEVIGQNPVWILLMTAKTPYTLGDEILARYGIRRKTV
jgi:hypothetical protein